ncbi:MAG: hypothetical protein Q9216_004955 [Gyalolechia sp. 2 TL-2023]
MEQECQKLRLELKEWEKTFAAANGGRKAGREDIKRNADIGSDGELRSYQNSLAIKYKLYNKLRAGEAACSRPKDDAPRRNQSPMKRRAGKPPTSAETPRKRSKHVHAPPENNVAVLEQAIDSPHSTPVAHRQAIGPTPQKNGRVLGLFDLLTPSSRFRTPSKRQSLAPLPPNVVGTPSKQKPKDEPASEEQPASSTKRRSRSPPSSSKRMYLASFLTPSTRRIADVGDTPQTTTSVSKLRFDDTPVFLRRDSQRFTQSQKAGQAMNGNEEDGSSWSPVAVRVMRPKPARRALSALVKGLREMEEADLDDDLEMLREVEGEGIHAAESQIRSAPQLCVEDSQAPDMPLGPDGQGESDDEDLEALPAEGKGRNGKPLKVWKKRGQKRTTRRVTIKPNTAKWKPEPEWKGGKDEESEGEVTAVEETQFIAAIPNAEQGTDVEDLQTEDDYVTEGASDKGEPQTKTKVQKAKQQGRPAEAQKAPANAKKKKPVNALAHANFRALKIKNKNSKAKGRGRFGRRR